MKLGKSKKRVRQIVVNDKKSIIWYVLSNFSNLQVEIFYAIIKIKKSGKVKTSAGEIVKHFEDCNFPAFAITGPLTTFCYPRELVASKYTVGYKLPAILLPLPADSRTSNKYHVNSYLINPDKSIEWDEFEMGIKKMKSFNTASK